MGGWTTVEFIFVAVGGSGAIEASGPSEVELVKYDVDADKSDVDADDGDDNGVDGRGELSFASSTFKLV